MIYDAMIVIFNLFYVFSLCINYRKYAGRSNKKLNYFVLFQDTPRQTYGNDCGVFIIMVFASVLARFVFSYFYNLLFNGFLLNL